MWNGTTDESKDLKKESKKNVFVHMQACIHNVHIVVYIQYIR